MVRPPANEQPCYKHCSRTDAQRSFYDRAKTAPGAVSVYTHVMVTDIVCRDFNDQNEAIFHRGLRSDIYSEENNAIMGCGNSASTA